MVKAAKGSSNSAATTAGGKVIRFVAKNTRCEPRAGSATVVFDLARLRIARKIQTTSCRHTLRKLAEEDIQYAASTSTAPTALLPAIQRHLTKLRPGDAAFARMVDELCAACAAAWDKEGRSVESVYRLCQLAASNDKQALMAEIQRQYLALETVSPVTDTIRNQRKFLVLLALRVMSAKMRAPAQPAQPEM